MRERTYNSPEAEVFTVVLDNVICGTTPGQLNFSGTPGGAGDDIDNSDIIDGGSF